MQMLTGELSSLANTNMRTISIFWLVEGKVNTRERKLSIL